MRFFKLTMAFLLLNCQAFANVELQFNELKKDPNALYAFLKAMPKGGELHYHLAGGAYPETMIAVASQSNYCLNPNNFEVTKVIENCPGVPVQELPNKPALYQRTIEAWSMKNFKPQLESGHDHFFNSFKKFMPVVINSRATLLAEIMQRAADQHEQYLEIMILPDNANSTSFPTTQLLNKPLDVAQNQLLANPDFQKNIQFTVDQSTAILKKAREHLGCDQNPKLDVCQLTIKFQYYVLREQPLERVFAQALNGFAAAAKSKDLIAVNLVQPEDGYISLRDYHQQMEIFAFLRKTYPAVHLSLHAGELSPQDVLPSALNFHITEAVDLAKAERIGHGVAIAYENNVANLLKTMANQHIAVEINLTSNKKILNIKGKKHPLRYYLANKVPVVLSTDDEGILRTTLTQEYVEAVLNHDIDYKTLKMINRNALTYSFLPGKSLWLDPTNAKTVEECSDLQSTACKEFVRLNEKAKLQRQLEMKLIQFEQSYSQ